MGPGAWEPGNLQRMANGSHEVTLEQNPESVGASPVEPGRGHSKSRGPARKDARAASPHPIPRTAFSRRQDFGFYSELDAKPPQGLETKGVTRSDLVPRVIFLRQKEEPVGKNSHLLLAYRYIHKPHTRYN